MTSIFKRMGDYTLTELTYLEAYNRDDGLLDFMLNELDSFTINHNQEESDITGRNGRVIGKKKKNKTVSCDGTNGLISEGLLKAQTGGDIASGDFSIKKFETKEVTADMAIAVDAVPLGTEGEEIGKIQLLGDGGTIIKEYLQGTVATADKFSYDPLTSLITLPTDTDIEVGMHVRYAYYRTVTGTRINDPSGKYSEIREIWLHGYGVDRCDNAIAFAWYFPRADFSGEFSVDLGGDQTMHNFSFNALPDYCNDDEGDLDVLYIYKDGDIVTVSGTGSDGSGSSGGTGTIDDSDIATDDEVEDIFS